MSFGEKTLTWRSYNTNKALSTTKQVQIINKKNFIIAVLNGNSETFIVHVAIREHKKMAINLAKKI